MRIEILSPMIHTKILEPSDAKTIKEMLSSGIGLTAVADALGVTSNTLRRMVERQPEFEISLPPQRITSKTRSSVKIAPIEKRSGRIAGSLEQALRREGYYLNAEICEILGISSRELFALGKDKSIYRKLDKNRAYHLDSTRQALQKRQSRQQQPGPAVTRIVCPCPTCTALREAAAALAVKPSPPIVPPTLGEIIKECLGEAGFMRESTFRELLKECMREVLREFGLV